MTTGKTGNTQGRSQRHSKIAKPVTIDLKAEDVKADPTKNADTEKSTAASASAASSKSVPQAGPKRPVQDATVKTSNDIKETAAMAASAGSANPAGANDVKNQASKATEAPAPGKVGKAPTGGSGNGDSGAGKGRSGSAIVGGLVGGVVALLAMYGAQYAGLLPTPGGSSAVEETAAVSSEVGQLKTTVDQLSSTVSKLSMGDGNKAPDLSALTGRLDALESAATTEASSVETSPILTDMESRISALSQRVDTLGADTGGAVTSEISNLRTTLGELAQQVAALETKQTELAQSLTARIDKAEEAANGPGKDLAMARAIAVSGLKTAIDRGGPFASELEAFASVSPDDPAIGDLRSFAATGVPTNGQLIADFPDAANRMVASMNPVAEDAGLVQRLWSSAQTVVKVRKVGDVEGDGTEAIVVRLETHLKNGNLDAARAEWAKLPEEAKTAAEDFGKALAARAEIAKLLAAVQIAAPPPTAENSDQAADGAATKTAE